MKKTTTLLLLLISFFAYSQNTKEILLNDLVKIEDSKFTITDYTLLSNDTKTIQVKAYAEAPKSGLISRDYFIMIFSNILGQFINETTDQYELKTENLNEIIGKPDIEINIYMANAGIQVEVNAINQKTTRNTYKWSDFLE